MLDVTVRKSVPIATEREPTIVPPLKKADEQKSGLSGPHLAAERGIKSNSTVSSRTAHACCILLSACNTYVHKMDEKKKNIHE